MANVDEGHGTGCGSRFLERGQQMGVGHGVQGDDFGVDVGALELGLWRGFAQTSFYALSFLIRPWNFLRLIKNMITNEGVTSLEQRANALFRRRSTPAGAPRMAEQLNEG